MAVSVKKGMPKEIFCVECPLLQAYVPIEGNCYIMESKENIIFGEGGPSPESSALYNVNRKCEHALNATFGPFSGDLEDVTCGYKQ
jgi:hypothetical protein